MKSWLSSKFRGPRLVGARSRRRRLAVVSRPPTTVWQCFSELQGHLYCSAANPAGAALHGIGPGSFRPARHAAANTVTQLKQGLAWPVGHSVEATASICWLLINAFVPNDTKVCTDAAAMTSSYYSVLSFHDGLVAELGLGDGPSDFDRLTQAGSLPVSPSSLIH